MVRMMRTLDIDHLEKHEQGKEVGKPDHVNESEKQ